MTDDYFCYQSLLFVEACFSVLLEILINSVHKVIESLFYFQPLTIITKRSILDAAAALDPPLSLLSTEAYLGFRQTSMMEFLRK